MNIRRYIDTKSGGSRVRQDGPALMLSTAAAATCSLMFWVVAARSYPVDAVGQAAAEISALTMLAGFAQLNLMSVFVRFLVSAGNRVLRLLSYGYAGITCASVIIGTTFLLLGLGQGFMGNAWWEKAAFVLAVAVLAVFVVQDGVLTAFVKAPWVPVENLMVALARLAMLGLLLPALLGAGGASRLSIICAWCVPALFAVAAVSFAIFGNLAPGSARWSPHGSLLPSRRELSAFVLAEYLNNLVTNVTAFIPPLLILHLLGARAAAYFNVPWLVVIVTQTLLWNIGMSFVAESTRRPDEITTHVRHAVRLGAIVVAGSTMALLIGAPLPPVGTDAYHEDSTHGVVLAIHSNTRRGRTQGPMWSTASMGMDSFTTSWSTAGHFVRACNGVSFTFTTPYSARRTAAPRPPGGG